MKTGRNYNRNLYEKMHLKSEFLSIPQLLSNPTFSGTTIPISPTLPADGEGTGDVNGTDGVTATGVITQSIAQITHPVQPVQPVQLDENLNRQLREKTKKSLEVLCKWILQ
jgi:hypothetical protein